MKKIPPAFEKKNFSSRKLDFSTGCVNKKDCLKEKPKSLFGGSSCNHCLVFSLLMSVMNISFAVEVGPVTCSLLLGLGQGMERKATRRVPSCLVRPGLLGQRQMSPPLRGTERVLGEETSGTPETGREGKCNQQRSCRQHHGVAGVLL